MPPRTKQPTQYLVHHQGQVQGPFDVDFIEAMVMSGVYPSSVLVQKDEASERLPFSNLVVAADSRPPSHKNPKTKKTKPETVAAWVVGAFGVCFVLWALNLVTSSKKPTTSRFDDSAQRNITNSPDTQPEIGKPSSIGRNYSPSASKPSQAPMRVPSPMRDPDYSTQEVVQPNRSVERSVPTTAPARASSTPPSYPPADDSMIYRDESGRSYRVSNADYNRLLGMRSALTPKSAQIDHKKQERQALSNQLDIERTTLDPTSQYAVDSFNLKINRLNAMNGPLQIMVADFNRDVDAFNTELERVGTPIN